MCLGAPVEKVEKFPLAFMVPVELDERTEDGKQYVRVDTLTKLVADFAYGGCKTISGVPCDSAVALPLKTTLALLVRRGFELAACRPTGVKDEDYAKSIVDCLLQGKDNLPKFQVKLEEPTTKSGESRTVFAEPERVFCA